MEKNVYMEIGLSRLLDIRVILDDTKTLYEGLVEDAPIEIKQLKYSQIKNTDKVNFYVYSEFNSI